jgi:transposase
LVFDCGGNTLENKREIRKPKFHYLTLKAKKKGLYWKEITVYHSEKENQVSFVSNDRGYSCVKNQSGEEIRYVFFSEDLEHDQLLKKADKFQRELEKGLKLSKKVERGKDLGHYITPKGWIIARDISRKHSEKSLTHT